MIYDVLDRAQARATIDEARLLAARARWAQLAGTVHDDSPIYEERAAAFLEWYLIDHAAEGEAEDQAEGERTGERPGPAEDAALVAEPQLAARQRAEELPGVAGAAGSRTRADRRECAHAGERTAR